ncbi:MAG: hypothetical protein OXC08_20815 [Thiotrichales bacterium]|nr:hypothetical protein [Thiotrichales bacterium]
MFDTYHVVSLDDSMLARLYAMASDDPEELPLFPDDAGEVTDGEPVEVYQ